MNLAYEVFYKEREGTFIWRITAATAEEATTRVGELAINSPGEYIILNCKTGEKKHVTQTSGAEPRERESEERRAG
jgi:hypothetical protein